MKKNVIKSLLMSSVLFLMACSSGETPNLSGAGATFPEPFYKLVFKKFSTKEKNQITYGAIGSGGGYRSLKDKTVDFGASDVFLSDEEMKDLGAPVVHIPTVLGAVVLSYNLPGIDELKLNSDLIGDIFLGKIKKWNDPAIQAVNKGKSLPDQNITVVYRSDGSGSTAVFSEYMSKVNNAWKEKIGKGKSLKFPVGVSAKGNAGVAGLISETKGAIGYIGSEYSLAMNIPMAMIQNKSGNFIKVTTESISAAANGDIPEDTRTSIVDSSNPDAYPISTFTWLIVYQEQNYNGRTESQAKALKSLLEYVLSNEAQALAPQINYAPLSSVALEKAKNALERMTYNGKPIK